MIRPYAGTVARVDDRYLKGTVDLPFIEVTLPLRSIPEARMGASEYVRSIAEGLTAELGFGFTASKDAPRSVEDLHRAVARSMATSVALPVACELSASSALDDPESDLSLEIWRSIVRFRRDLGFDAVDELAVDLELLDTAAFAGVGTPARSVLYAALVGKTMCAAVLGTIPADARQFTENVLTYGLTDAILLEHESPP
jgi:hypothetical protein